MDIPDRPVNVIWDVTYACPLRCIHCYSESGRRPTRQLSHDDMLRVADAISSLQPAGVALSGGEPFVVKGIVEIAERMARAGAGVVAYTSGWPLEPWMIERMPRVFAEVTVSVDGATPDVHDRIRGRSGSFERAMNALAMLDATARRLSSTGPRRFRFGIDCVVVQSNFHQMEAFCTELAPRFPELRFLSFGAAVPSGLASRSTFADRELLTDSQVRLLGDAEHAKYLQSLSPSSVRVNTTDNHFLKMHPDLISRGVISPTMQVEPDGGVRAMPIYEGTVGNLLAESPALLWKRAVARWSDPFVTRTLAPVRTMKEWAEAARRIDYQFGSAEVRARIDRRAKYVRPSRAAAERWTNQASKERR